MYLYKYICTVVWVYAWENFLEWILLAQNLIVMTSDSKSGCNKYTLSQQNMRAPECISKAVRMGINQLFTLINAERGKWCLTVYSAFSKFPVSLTRYSHSYYPLSFLLKNTQCSCILLFKVLQFVFSFGHTKYLCIFKRIRLLFNGFWVVCCI